MEWQQLLRCFKFLFLFTMLISLVTILDFPRNGSLIYGGEVSNYYTKNSNNQQNSSSTAKTVTEPETKMKTKTMIDKKTDNNNNDSVLSVGTPSESQSELQSRPLLIFNHNAKAGGGSIKNVLEGFKSNTLKCGKNDDNNKSGCNSKVWDIIHRYENQNTTTTTTNTDNNNNNNFQSINNTLLLVEEAQHTTLWDKQNGFIIGSIREPCSQYLSLWSFGSLGTGALRLYTLNEPQLYGESPPLFNTPSDIQRFHTWMKHPKVVGMIGHRVKSSYDYDYDHSNGSGLYRKNNSINNNSNSNKSNNIVDNVDCWVFVENFQQSLFHCLVLYENQGGYVDWQSKTVSQLKKDVLQQEQHQDQQKENNQKQNNNNRSLLEKKHNYIELIEEALLEVEQDMEAKGKRKREDEEKKRHNNRRNRVGNHYTRRDPTHKNDPLGDPRTHHHGSCQDFFYHPTTTTATTTTTNNSNNTNNNTDYDYDYDFVQQTVLDPHNELFIYQQFGYEGCCNPGNRYLGYHYNNYNSNYTTADDNNNNK